jgi:hypothetical protein
MATVKIIYQHYTSKPLQNQGSCSQKAKARIFFQDRRVMTTSLRLQICNTHFNKQAKRCQSKQTIPKTFPKHSL